MFLIKRLFYSFFLLIVMLLIFIAFYNPSNSISQDSSLIVILGAGYSKQGLPVLALEKRLDKAVSLWNIKSNTSTQIMISGRAEEVYVMSAYLRQKGIDKQHIIRDIKGENTRMTVQNAWKLAKKNRTVPLFVSQAYHLPRIFLYNFVYGDNKANYIATDRVDISFKYLFYVSIREVFAIILFPYFYFLEFLK